MSTVKIYTDHFGVYLRVEMPNSHHAGYVRAVGAEHTSDLVARERRITYAETLGKLLGVSTEVTPAEPETRADFDALWTQYADLGLVDALGGAEYREALSRWEARRILEAEYGPESGVTIARRAA